MYNTSKYCKTCNWERTYDDKRDTQGIGDYIRCPICGDFLSIRGYSHDI